MTDARSLLRRTLRPLLLLGVAGGIVTGLVVARQPPRFEVALGFSVPVPAVRGLERAGEKGGSDPVDATDLFVGTLAGFLQSPDFVADVYRRASLEAPRTSVQKLSRTMQAQRRGGQVVDVRFSARSEDEGRTLARAVKEEVAERVSALSTQDAALPFEVVAGEPLIVPVVRSPLLRGLVAAVIIGALGINLVFLWDFLRSPPGAPTGGGV